MKIIKVNRSGSFAKSAVATQQNQLPVEWAMSTYAPGLPIQPFVRPQETRVPREIDYPISVNASLQPRTGYGLLDFGSIRDVYETITEVRMPVATGIRHLTGFIPHLVDDDGNEIDDHPYKWMTVSPDGSMPFDVWLTRFMKSSDIFDAGTFSIQREGGQTVALNYIDGSTLFIIVDEHGRIPHPNDYNPAVALTPEYAKKFIEYNRAHPGKLKSRLSKAATGQPMVLTPAFVQVIKGTPFAWYTSDEIWYKPRYTRFDAPYGETFIEMAWAWIMIIANITGFELAHYREGNMPEGWWEAPDGWTLDRVAAYEAAWNSRMSSGPTERMRSRFAVFGMKWHETKKADFPNALYQKAFNNLVLTFGYPPSEFGEISGKGLGGKDMGDLLQDKSFRDAIIPRKTYLENAFNNILRDDGVDDARFELQLPGESLDPEKEKQGIYDGVAHGVYTPNDALGRLGFDPMEGSMTLGSKGEMIPDHSHIGNKHMIIAGTTIYVLEDMQTQGGIAMPPFGQKPGAQPEEALPMVPKPAEPAKSADFEQQRGTVKEILSSGHLPGGTKTYSLPPVAQFPVTTKASQSLPPGIDDSQYILGLQEEQEHSETVGGDQSVIAQIVLDHLREDPQYYTHLHEAHGAEAEKRYEVKGTTVYNAETGKPVPGGEHKTEEQAQAHMRALYANVPDAQKGDLPGHEFHGNQWDGGGGGLAAHGDYIRGLSKDQFYAMRRYTGGDFNGMNAHLRFGKQVSPNIVARAETLKNVIEQAPKLEEETTLSRFVSGDPAKYGLEEGSTWMDKGFTSTSLNPDYGAQVNGVRFAITAPAGTSGLAIGAAGGHGGENEFLLPPGTKFLINSIKQIDDLHWVVNARITQ